MPPNPFLLASDAPNQLLTLLRAEPHLAPQQDAHGYSLLHAAASYNHLDLLRALVREFHVPVALGDEDAETALFVVETVAAARVLVDELGLDHALRNDDGATAREKMEADGEWPEVVAFLRAKEEAGATTTTNGVPAANGRTNGDGGAVVNGEGGEGGLPPVPAGLQVTFGTMSEADGGPPDPAFRRRVEELAAREDFHTEAGQAELRRLVEEAVHGGEGLAEERNVRPRREG